MTASNLTLTSTSVRRTVGNQAVFLGAVGHTIDVVASIQVKSDVVSTSLDADEQAQAGIPFDMDEMYDHSIFSMFVVVGTLS